MQDEILKVAAEYQVKHPNSETRTSDIGKVSHHDGTFIVYTKWDMPIGSINLLRSIVTVRKDYRDAEMLHVLKSNL